MRSPAATLFLAATAIALVVLSGIAITENGLDRFFTGKPLPEGARLYDFTPKQVRHIRISHAGATMRFERIGGVWQAIAPWRDRMDPRLAGLLIAFTLQTTVQDAIPMDKVDTRLVGLKTGNITVRLADGANQELAHYVLGRRTAWFVETDEKSAPLPTVFLRPLENGRRDYIYACSGDPHPIFRDGLQRLRDHRPLYFNPKTLTSIRIRGPEGELKLARKSPANPWRIVKPLELPTEKDAVRRLVEGLYQLTAIKVSDPDETTPPTAEGDASAPIEIGIESLGSKKETTLRIAPRPEPDAQTAPATVGDRKAVFELPLRPGAAGKAVAVFSLPLTVNDLRDKKLTHLNIASLHSMLISPAARESILVTRMPRSPWKFMRGSKAEDANEQSVFNLLKAMTENDVAGFVTDTATDFKPYGLDKPFLILRFLSFDNQGLEIRFARGPKGDILANRLGSPTVVKIDDSLLGLIATRPYQWKSTRLWNLSRVDVVGIQRQSAGAKPLDLAYSFLEESWRATRDGKDVTADLNENRANFLLDSLEDLHVARWLGPDNSEAATALLAPALTLRVLQRNINDLGDSTGLLQRTILLSPISKSPENQFFYGMVEGNPNFFILDRKAHDSLAVDLFDQ